MTHDYGDLDWLAFLYLSGELSLEEHAAFEQRLAHEQDACDALVRATRLIGALTTESPVCVPRVERPIQHGWRAFAGVLTTAALVLVGVSLVAVRPLGVNRNQTSEEPIRELVSLWRDAETEEADEAERDRASSLDTEVDELTIPSWLLAALDTDQSNQADEE